MSKYIQIISKIKPKNYQNTDFKIADLTDIQVNFITNDYNVFCANGNTITKSGIDWNLKEKYCLIGGNLYINGSLFQNSDENLKSNIIPISNSLQIIKNLKGVQFNWKKDGKLDYGMIAQEVQKIIPEMVSINKSTGYKQISYIKLIPFLLQSIKILNKRIQILESKKFNLFQNFKKLIKYISSKLTKKQ